ncbi:MarR family transcriptional regulator, partial [Pseudoalteromonas sp. SIMBA_148]
MSKDTPTNSTLFRALGLREEIVTTQHAVSAADLEKRFHIPKPTVHRLLKQLEEQQLISRDLDGRHLLPGPRFR